MNKNLDQSIAKFLIYHSRPEIERVLQSISPKEMIELTDGRRSIRAMASVLYKKLKFRSFLDDKLKNGTEFEQWILGDSKFHAISEELFSQLVSHISKSNWYNDNLGALQSELIKYKKVKLVLES